MGEGEKTVVQSSAPSVRRKMRPRAVQFGEFELDAAAFELRRKGRPVRLERLPLELLVLLVSRKGELVTRNEIARKLWGDDVYVDTNTAINVVVRKARQRRDVGAGAGAELHDGSRHMA